MKEMLKKYRLPIIITAIVLAAALIVGIVMLVSKHNNIEQRNEAVEELLARKGDYDERSIVLYNTNSEAAKALAEKTGAKLRITENGRFATLTLPEDKSIIDIYSDDEFLSDIKKMSADWHVSASEINADEELTADTAERLPTRPRYSSTITDSGYSSQTYFDYMNLSTVWNTTKGSGITVAVIDTGIDTDHPEFAGRISDYSYNASEDKIVKDYNNDWSLIEDEQGHGTMVTGVIAAAMNGNGIVGIAPEVNIIVIKADCDEQGNFRRTSDLVFGLYYAIERDVDIVNMSFGSTVLQIKGNPFEEPLQLAVDSDVICVAAAGNESSCSLTVPAADPNCIGVGALAADSWELAGYSNYGENVDVVAPGTTLTTVMGGGYGYADGTSLSAPAVTGAVALYLSQNRYTEYKDLQEILYASCYDLGDLGKDFYYGYGAIDVSALILEERGRVTFDYLTDEIDNTEQVFVRNHTLQNMPIPERLYAIFDGWYYDDQMTEEYNWYADKFSTDLTLYANWVNEDDGVPYTYVELDDGTIEIRSYTGHRRYLVMPTYIDGKIVSSIGEEALKGQTRIKQITLPSKLVRIRREAFANCINLVNIHISDTVTEIKQGAFMNNIRMSSVTFGKDSQLKTIEDYVFYSCGKLKSFDAPKKLECIGLGAFEKCVNLRTLNLSNNESLKTIASEEISPTFGDCISLKSVIFNNNIPLKTIGDYAFMRCTSLETFEVPKNLVLLNGSVFFGDTSMQTFTVASGSNSFSATNGVLFNKSADVLVAYPAGVYGEYDMPQNVKTVGYCAFGYAKITGIDLSNIVSIESSAFEFSSLKSVGISDSVKEMGSNSFAENYQLEKLIIGHGLKIISDEAFSNDKLLSSVEISNSVETIGRGAFAGTALKKITFENESILTQINSYAFGSISSLGSITIPASVIMIDKCAFADDINLSSVIFETGSALNKIGKEAFNNTKSLKKIILPNKLQYIGDSAFASSGLTEEIFIPASVTYIGVLVFDCCTNLEYIKVDTENEVYKDIDGVVYSKDEKTLYIYPCGNKRYSYTIAPDTETVYDYAFCRAFNLKSVNTSNIVTVGEYGFFECINVDSYILSNGLESIKRYAFSYNISLQKLSMPDSLIQISNYAFAEDINLYSVTFTENSKLPRISFGAFAYCGLTSFRVPANVSTMAQYAFEGCSRLTSFTFAGNSKLESISAYMFDGCDNLQSITFENGSKLTSIQAHGLEGMRRLTSIDFGDAKITNIDNFAFRFCESLTSFDIPEGVTYLGRYAFYQCKNLSEVRLPVSLEYIGRYAFLQTNSAQLYFTAETLPETLQEDWDYGAAGYYLGVTNVKETDDWKYAELSSGGIAILQYKGTDKNIDMTALDLGGDIVNIGGKAFRWSEIESVVIPDTVKIIQNEAFYHSSLKSVTIPASVTFIGKKAFEYTLIETLTFAANSNLKTIEYSAFEGTEKLTSVTIPKSVETLGRAVFKNSNISSLTFESGSKLTEIPKEAFAYTKITSLSIPDSVGIVWDNAFRQTEKLESVDFGNNPDLKIRSNAFYQSGFKTLNIPANVTYIGEYSFVALESLQNFTVDENNPYYKSVDGLLVSKDGRKLISVPAGRTGSLTVPEGIEVIGFGAFENSKLTTVIFRSDANILSFGYRAFFGMKNMKQITIPASVVSIDYYAFAYCENLEKVTFADGSKLTGVYEGAFCGDIRLSDIELPETIIEISDFAFYGCESITEIPVSSPENLKGIYSYAFAYTGISGEFTTPENLIDIGAYAFMGLDVTKITVPDTQQYDLVIGIGAFENCNKLEEITLPFIGASLDDMNICWFGFVFGAGSYNSQNKYIPASLKTVFISEGQSVIGTGAFYNIQSIETVSFPLSIAVIDKYSFADSTFLYDLKSPVSFIGSQDMFIYGSLGYIGKGIREIVLSDSILGIGDSAFYECDCLESITLSKNIRYIESNSFAHCYNLNRINVYSIEDWCKINFHESNYWGGGFWSEYSLYLNGELIDEITIPSDCEEIKDRAFSGFRDIKSVIIPYGVKRIGKYAFSGCRNLENVIIPNSVKIIDEWAFSSCMNLQTLTIPDSVEYIGKSVFAASGIKSIDLGEGVTSLGDYAFEYCGELFTLTVGSNLQNIGANSFYGCDNLYCIYNNSNLIFNIGSTDYGQIALYVKKIVNKNGTIQYKDDSYENLETEDGFIFEYENGVYRLRAYMGNEKSITFPDSINGSNYTIYKFEDKNNTIESITIPDTVSEIKNMAFWDCNNVKTITIGEKVAKIGRYVFTDLKGLTKLVIDGNNKCYSETDGMLLYHTDEQTELFACLPYISHNVVIPDGVTKIGENAFWRADIIRSVTLPDSVIRIEKNAFSECSNLEEVHFGVNLESIGEYAFSSCISLKDFELPENISEIGDGAFFECKTIKSITIPDSVTNVGYQAFGLCENLSTVIFGNKVKDIRGYAFYDCNSLEKIIIPKNVENIHSSAFINCSSLETVEIDMYNPYLTVINGVIYNKELTRIITVLPYVSANVEIPYGVTEIGDSVFRECKNIQTVKIPETVTIIGNSAFYGCSNLTDINIPNIVTEMGVSVFEGCSSLKSITLPGSVESFGARSFDNCVNLETVVFENGSKTIGSYIFENCVKLKTVVLPDTLERIYDYAFSGCVSLEKIILPDSLIDLQYGSFNNCSGLKDINIPDGINYIPDECFSYCYNLTNITIPDGVTGFGWRAFMDCTSLSSITIPSNLVNLSAYNIFTGCNHLNYIYNNSDFSFEIGSSDYGCLALYAIVIYNKDGSVQYRDTDYYLTDDGFLYQINENKYILRAYIGEQDTVELPKSINGNKYRVSDMRGVKNVIIPEGTEKIDAGAFYDCKSLTSIVIPSSVKEIGDSAFYGCSELVNIEIPDSVPEITWDTFYGCTSLSSIVIPDSVTTIQQNAFYNCRSLKSIKIPDSVTYINSQAFVGTGLYDDPDNWDNGCLYIDKWLIAVDSSVRYFDIRPDTRGIADGAYGENNMAKFSYDNYLNLPNSMPNVVSTVMWNRKIESAFNPYAYGHNLPITFKNCIIPSNSEIISSYAFSYIYGITIWVEANEKDCRWDENFPGWNNGNTVVYGEDWSYTNFYDVDGNLIYKEPRINSKVIIHPYYKLDSDAQYDYLVGWDLDGDGIEDPIPATSTNEIQANAIITEKKIKSYTVKFIDYDGTVLDSEIYNYGEIPEIPDVPIHTGNEVFRFNFIGWSKNVSEVTADKIYEAQYKKEYVEYIIKFVDYNDREICSGIYHYGDIVIEPASPSREDDDKFTYTFKGWDKEITAVEGSVTYTATYDRKEKEQTQFMLGDINGDGKTNNKDVVALFRYVSSGNGNVVIAALDTNGDGKLNNKDVVTLFRYVSNNNNPISTKPYDPNAKVMITAIIPDRTKMH